MRKLLTLLIFAAPLFGSCGCASIESDRMAAQLDTLQQFMERTGASGTIEVIADPTGHIGLLQGFELKSASMITARIQFNARGGE